MADALSDQLALTQLGGQAIAGLGGASAQDRSAEQKGRLRVSRFSFTIPASGAGSASGDRVKLALLNVLSRIIGITVFNPGLGSGLTIALGKIDPNNSSNTDNVHYLAATAAATANTLTANLNITEQVGADPSGATTDTGNAPPAYGSQDIVITMTFGGGNPSAASFITGFILYSPGA